MQQVHKNSCVLVSSCCSCAIISLIFQVVKTGSESGSLIVPVLTFVPEGLDISNLHLIRCRNISRVSVKERTKCGNACNLDVFPGLDNRLEVKVFNSAAFFLVLFDGTQLIINSLSCSGLDAVQVCGIFIKSVRVYFGEDKLLTCVVLQSECFVIKNSEFFGVGLKLRETLTGKDRCLHEGIHCGLVGERIGTAAVNGGDLHLIDNGIIVSLGQTVAVCRFNKLNVRKRRLCENEGVNVALEDGCSVEPVLSLFLILRIFPCFRRSFVGTVISRNKTIGDFLSEGYKLISVHSGISLGDLKSQSLNIGFNGGGLLTDIVGGLQLVHDLLDRTAECFFVDRLTDADNSVVVSEKLLSCHSRIVDYHQSIKLGDIILRKRSCFCVRTGGVIPCISFCISLTDTFCDIVIPHFLSRITVAGKGNRVCEEVIQVRELTELCRCHRALCEPFAELVRINACSQNVLDCGDIVITGRNDIVLLRELDTVRRSKRVCTV